MNPKKPRLLPFLILTAITLITWAILDVWRTFNKPLPIEVPPEIIKDFDPNLDKDAMNKIKERVFFTDEEARSFISQKKQTSAATSASESAQINP